MRVVTGRSRQEELYKIPDRVIAPAHIKGMHNYLTTWEKSVDATDEFWGAQALERLSWFAPPKTVTRGGLAGGDVAWFPDGVLNVSCNCLDRHPPDRVAIIWEGDEPTDVKHITCALRAHALTARCVSPSAQVDVPPSPHAARHRLAATERRSRTRAVSRTRTRR